jgi:hypothetical protein
MTAELRTGREDKIRRLKFVFCISSPQKGEMFKSRCARFHRKAHHRA